MKKRILAMVLALTMVFTFVGVSASEITSSSTLKDVIDAQVNGAPLDSVIVSVPLDIQLKESGASSWAESLTVKTSDPSSIPTFDFMATLKMSAVKDAFELYVNKAKSAIEAKAVDATHKTTLETALNNVPVTGQFVITISLPEGITFDAKYKTNNSMQEFNAGAKAIFKESKARVESVAEKTITLTIDVVDDQTKSTLDGKFDEDITFNVEGVEINALGEYQVKVMFDGYTNIGDIAKINYKSIPLDVDAETSVDHNPDKIDAPWASATVKAEKKSNGSSIVSGGGSSAPTQKEYKVEFVVDGEVYASVNTKDGSVNVSEITPAEKEGYEFEGWYLDKEYTKPAPDTLKASANTKVYAKYVIAGIGEGPVLNADDHGAYIIGYTDGTVRPLNNIVREEVAAIFFRLLTEAAGEAMHKDVAPYSDVPATKWSSTAIATLANGGYITGRPDGTFGPNDYITRAEFATIAARFTKYAEGNGVEFSDVQGHWAKNYIEACAANGLITGYTDGTFKPDQFITRAEVMAIVNRMLDREVDAEGIAAVADDIYYFGDNAENTWCYYIVLEATNAHDYTRTEDGKETWTKVTEVRDWTAYEK